MIIFLGSLKKREESRILFIHLILSISSKWLIFTRFSFYPLKIIGFQTGNILSGTKYAKIDGIETSRLIKSRFDIRWYFWIMVLGIWYHKFGMAFRITEQISPNLCEFSRKNGNLICLCYQRNIMVREKFRFWNRP